MDLAKSALQKKGHTVTRFSGNLMMEELGLTSLSGCWKGEHEGLCAMRPNLGSERVFLNLRPHDLKSGVLTAWPRGRFWKINIRVLNSFRVPVEN